MPNPEFQESMKKSGSSAANTAAAAAAVQQSSQHSLSAPRDGLQVRRSSAPGAPGQDAVGGGAGSVKSSLSPPGTTTNLSAQSATLGGSYYNINVSKSACTSPVGAGHGPPGSGGSSSGGTGGSGGGSGSGGGGGGNSDKSGSPRHRTSNDAWVCPNDRQLALRAK